MEKSALGSKKDKNIVRSFDDKPKKKSARYTGLISIIMMIALGVGSGFLLAQLTIATGVVDKKIEVRELAEGEEVKRGLVVGVNDKSQFPDVAEGELFEGGINGEGTHHLERPGGPSQNVYLTSSNVDLTRFVGHKVKVNGKTFAAEHAGWLMDVGQLEVLE